MRQHSTHHSHSMPASFQHFQVPSPRLSTNTNFSTGDRGGRMEGLHAGESARGANSDTAGGETPISCLSGLSQFL